MCNFCSFVCLGGGWGGGGWGWGQGGDVHQYVIFARLCGWWGGWKNLCMLNFLVQPVYCCLDIEHPVSFLEVFP